MRATFEPLSRRRGFRPREDDHIEDDPEFIGFGLLGLLLAEEEKEARAETAPMSESEGRKIAEVRPWFVRRDVDGVVRLRVGQAREVGEGDLTEQVTRSVRLLLDGPGDGEQRRGFETEIPPGTKIIEVRQVTPGHVGIELSEEFAMPAGSLGIAPRIDQVVYTATEIPGVKLVTITLEGKRYPLSLPEKNREVFFGQPRGRHQRPPEYANRA